MFGGGWIEDSDEGAAVQDDAGSDLPVRGDALPVGHGEANIFRPAGEGVEGSEAGAAAGRTTEEDVASVGWVCCVEEYPEGRAGGPGAFAGGLNVEEEVHGSNGETVGRAGGKEA